MQEARRLADLDARRNPPTIAGQVEAAYAERDNAYCCIDCDPYHPAHIERTALEEIAGYREMPLEVKV